MPNNFKETILKIIRNNNLLFTVLLVAILLLIAIKILTPSMNKVINPEPEENIVISTLGDTSSNEWRQLEKTVEKELANFLSKIDGCGKVEILLHYAADEARHRAIDTDKTETITEEKDADGSTRLVKEVRITEETVHESSSGSTKTVWLNKEAPRIDGVVVIAVGANDIRVKAKLVEAVSTYFNIPVYKISVMAGGN